MDIITRKGHSFRAFSRVNSVELNHHVAAIDWERCKGYYIITCICMKSKYYYLQHFRLIY